MKICHINKFHYLRGGSEAVYFGTAEILRARGHQSVFFSMRHPDNLACAYSDYFLDYLDLGEDAPDFRRRVGAASRILYSFASRNRLEKLLRAEKPDIAHLHNIHHQISPSILHSLKKFRIPVVMTLHDYKMVCPSYSMLNHGKVCQVCQGGRYWRCFAQACTKGSKAKSLLNTVEMYLHHNILRLYDLVDTFISPSLFLKNKLQEMGFRKKIVHCPNFVILDGVDADYTSKDRVVVYVGRLSEEKGVLTLIAAAKKLSGIALKIIGTGPLEEKCRATVKDEGVQNISFLGHLPWEELKQEIKKSMFLVLPSECFENNPRSVIEGFALGKPAIGSDIGGIPELIRENISGRLFKAGDSVDLRDKIERLAGMPDEISRMGRAARALVEAEYIPELYYQRLNAIYRECLTEVK